MTPEQHGSKTEGRGDPLYLALDYVGGMIDELLQFGPTEEDLRKIRARVTKALEEHEATPSPQSPAEPGQGDDLPAREAIEWAARVAETTFSPQHDMPPEDLDNASYVAGAQIAKRIRALQPLSQGTGEAVAWQCKARSANTGANDPQDCDWPVCGCDPHAEALELNDKEQKFLADIRWAQSAYHTPSREQVAELLKLIDRALTHPSRGLVEAAEWLDKAARRFESAADDLRSEYKTYAQQLDRWAGDTRDDAEALRTSAKGSANADENGGVR